MYQPVEAWPNGCYFADIVKGIFFNEKFCIYNKGSHKLVSMGPIDN